MPSELDDPAIMAIKIHQIIPRQAGADLKCPLHHECDANGVSYCSSVPELDDRYGSVKYPCA